MSGLNFLNQVVLDLKRESNFLIGKKKKDSLCNPESIVHKIPILTIHAHSIEKETKVQKGKLFKFRVLLRRKG